MDIEKYWKDILKQDAEALKSYFDKEAGIKWHNTNESFNVEEFIKVNCEYPGDWDGEVERIEVIGKLIITVAHVWSKDKSMSFHVTSFIRLKNEKIISMDEYWGDDGLPPEWRRNSRIGRPIRYIESKEHSKEEAK